MILPSGIWVPDLFGDWTDKEGGLHHGRQMDVFNSRTRILLVSGSRLSGKTVACLHRLVRHMWETPGASVAMIAKTKTLIEDAGSWRVFTKHVIPEWIEANIGFHYTSRDSTGNLGPRSNSSTRTASFTTTNMHTEKLPKGHPYATSECLAFSIANEADVSSVMKNKYFSLVYFVELSSFKTKAVMTFTQSCLRMQHLKPSGDKPDVYHQWIGDTNPDERLGKGSWIYQHFYTEREGPFPDTKEGREDARYFKDVDVIEMFMDDNPHATEQEKNTLRVQCRGDEGLTDSHVLGRHGKGDQDSRLHFAELWSDALFVVGEPGGGRDDDGVIVSDQIAVNPMTTILLGGWDVGDVNHGAGIIDMWHPPRLPGMTEDPPVCFSVLDELVSLDERIRLEDYTADFTQKMTEIELRNGKPFIWEHFIDDAALTMHHPSATASDYLTIIEASEGRIDESNFFGVNKPHGSIRARVRLVRKLLREGRLFVSARCPHMIAMFKNLEKGDTDATFVIRAGVPGRHKHSFDWLSYVLYVKCWEELYWGKDQRTPPASPLSIVSI